MNSSEWIRVKRGQALRNFVGSIGSNNELTERSFANRPILFDGKTVSDCCSSSEPPISGVITFGFGSTARLQPRVSNNTISFNAIDGYGTVDFGNGTILPISSITPSVDYPAGNSVSIYSPNINTLGITPNTLITSVLLIDVLSLEILVLEDQTNLSSITGVGSCTGLISLVSTGCNLSTLDVTGCTTLRGLYCSNNASLAEIVGLASCTQLQNLRCDACSLSSLDVSPFVSTLSDFSCAVNPLLTQITGLNLCSALTILIVNDCNISTLDITNSASTLSDLRCFGNVGITSLNFSGCTKLNNVECSDCSITQTNADTIVAQISANAVSEGTLSIIAQSTESLDDSGWSIPGWTIS
jgi:hypothetical protein